MHKAGGVISFWFVCAIAWRNPTAAQSTVPPTEQPAVLTESVETESGANEDVDSTQTEGLQRPTASRPVTNVNIGGDYGLIVLDGDTFTTGGVVMRATTTGRPNVVAQPSGTSGSFVVGSASGQEKFLVRNDGVVGIGTMTPGAGGVYEVPLTLHTTGQLGSFLKLSNSDPTYKMGGIWLQERRRTPAGCSGWTTTERHSFDMAPAPRRRSPFRRPRTA